MMEKTLHNSDASRARENVPDIEFFGDGDLWQLLSKASSQSEGWMKSTKAMEVAGGCLVQVTTQQRNPNGSYALAEAVTFVPYVAISEVLLNDKVVGRRLSDKSTNDPFRASDPGVVRTGMHGKIELPEESYEHQAYGLRNDGTIGVIPKE